jgi:hypothetical protein
VGVGPKGVRGGAGDPQKVVCGKAQHFGGGRRQHGEEQVLLVGAPVGAEWAEDCFFAAQHRHRSGWPGPGQGLGPLHPANVEIVLGQRQNFNQVLAAGLDTAGMRLKAVAFLVEWIPPGSLLNGTCPDGPRHHQFFPVVIAQTPPDPAGVGKTARIGLEPVALQGHQGMQHAKAVDVFRLGFLRPKRPLVHCEHQRFSFLKGTFSIHCRCLDCHGSGERVTFSLCSRDAPAGRGSHRAPLARRG